MLLRNAAAGSDDAALVDDVATQLGGGARVLVTEGPEEVAAGLRDAAADGAVAVACGGDGSVSLAVATARRLGLLDELVLGILPLGTGNDLAGTLGLGDDLATAVAALRAGRTRRLDLAVVDDGEDVVVNVVHVGIGFDAAERATELKPGLGALAYPLGAMLAGVAAEGLALEIEVDGTQVGAGLPVLMAAVANGRTIGGGHPVAPDAAPDDGLLDVVVSHAVGPAERVGYAVALARGTHVDRPDVTVVRGREVVVTAGAGGVAHNRDGELTDAAPGRRTYRVVPGAWQALVPA